MALSEGSRVNTQQYQQMFLNRWLSRIYARKSTDQFKFHLVGSEACDIGLRGSDSDIMVTPFGIILDESSLVYREDQECYLRISTSRVRGKIPKVMLGDGEYVLAEPLRDMSEELFSGITAYIAGFDLSDSKVGKTTPGLDFVPQLRISVIPTTAKSFLTRKRSWPSNELVSLIGNGEFHLLARPAPYNPDIKHDFCLSFAKAESILIKAMSANQVICMRWLKRIRPLLDGGLGVLTSYHIKTILLWYSERIETEVWTQRKPVFDILHELDHNLKDKLLRHYFVPSMNLFAGIADSALMDVRRRLHSLFGFSIIAFDLTGINDHTRMLLAICFMINISEFIIIMESTALDQTTQNRYHNIIEQAEIVYMNTCNKTNRQSNILTDSLLDDYYGAPNIPTIISGVVKKLTNIRKLINKAADEHFRIGERSGVIDGLVPLYMLSINSPLDEIWPLKSIEPFICTGGHSGIAYQHPRSIMNSWLSFTYRVVRRLTSHANYIIDQLLVGLWIADTYERSSEFKTLLDVGASSKNSGCVSDMSTDYCGLDIDKLFSIDHVTNILLLSAINAAKELPPDLDFYSYSPVPTWIGDAAADLNTLNNMMERLFVPVEYAILTAIGLNTSDTSHYNLLEHVRVLNPESVEYQCASAFNAACEVVDNFVLLHNELHMIHGQMQFVAETSHSAQH